MNVEEAKKILALFRPGTADQNDPAFTEALALAKRSASTENWTDQSNAELVRWFLDHRSSYLSVRAKFQKIPVPAGLKEQIMTAGRPPLAPILPLQAIDFLRAAAVLALCLGVAGWLWRAHGGENNFETYRSRMTRVALQPYSMGLESRDWPAIKTFLVEHHAPADYVLPEGVKKTEPVGCAVLKWQGHPVSMLCFHSGPTIPESGKTDIWLFIVDQASVRNGPATPSPLLARIKKLSTAAWTRDGKIYILATEGDDAFLRKYL